MALRLVTPPAAEPITVAEAKEWLRLYTADDDATVARVISAARVFVEQSAPGRVLMPQTWVQTFGSFACEMKLGRAPLIEVESVQYRDADGDLQTLDPAEYEVDEFSEPAVLTAVSAWPATKPGRRAVRVQFQAGYADAAVVPENFKQAMRLALGHFYLHREAVITGTIVAENPVGVERLVGSDRLWGF